MSNAVPKPLPVCEGCRARKIRCDFYNETCGECSKIGMECVRTPTFTFKYHYGNKSKEATTFPSRQVWTLPKTALRYHDETPGIIDMYNVDTPATTLPAEATREAALHHTHSVSAIESPPAQPQSPISVAQAQVSPWGQSVNSDHITARLELTHPLSETDALLLRNYTENMALWADGTDPGRTFELEASRRALAEPVLLYAICAFSSRHANRHRTDQDHLALEYQSMCLQLLIPAISGPELVDESVLAAVAILRQNEEMDGKLSFERKPHTC